MTNITLAGRSGTEVVTRELALALRHAGHRPIVFSRTLGPIAHELRRDGVEVFDDILHMEGPIDIIHAHHNPVAAIAIARFPDVPAIFVSHSSDYWFDIPVRFPSIARYAAVDDTVARRLVEECDILPDRMQVILNAVNTTRFQPGPPLPTEPRQALAFAKNHGHLPAIEAACRSRGIALDIVGAAVGNVITEPEAILPQYDLVFASALSCIEALACARSVIVCDGRGLGGLVTTTNFAVWRRSNFGLGILTEKLTGTAVGEHLDRYDPADAANVGAMARQEANSELWAAAWIALYRDVIAERRTADVQQQRKAVAAHLQTWMPRNDGLWPWIEERERLIAQRNAAITGTAALAPGHPMSFAKDATPTTTLMYGFGEPEPWGVWTIAEQAGCLLAITDCAGDLDLELECVPFLNEHHPAISVCITGNSQRLGEWTLEYIPSMAGQPRRLTMWLPTRAVGTSGLIALSIRIRDPASPASTGVGQDQRHLGVGLISCALRQGVPGDQAIPRSDKKRLEEPS